MRVFIQEWELIDLLRKKFDIPEDKIFVVRVTTIKDTKEPDKWDLLGEILLEEKKQVKG